LRGEPTYARPATVIERFGRWCARKPAFAATTGGFLAALIAGFSLTFWQWRKAVIATQAKQEQLWQSQLYEARAFRISRAPGQRVKALEVLRRAAAFRPSIGLRNEAIAALLLPDLTPATSWHADRFAHAPFALTSDFKFSIAHRANGNLTIRHTEDYSVLAELRAAGPEPVCLQFSPADQWFGAAFADGCCQIWARNTRTPRLKWDGVSASINHPPFDFTPDGKRVVWLNTHGLHFENLSAKSAATTNEAIRGRSLRLSPTAQRVAVFREKSVMIWDLVTGQALASHVFGADVATVAWHPHEETLVVGTDADGFFVWDFPVQSPQHVGATHAAVTHLMFNSVGDLLFASGWNDLTEIWDTRDWTPLLKTTEGFTRQLSRDGSQVAFGREGSGYGIRGLLQPTAMEQWAVPPSLEAPTESARFSLDGAWLASAHHFGWLLWNASSGRIVSRRNGKQVQSCELLQDFSACITCDRTGVNLWPIKQIQKGQAPAIGLPVNLLTNGPPFVDRLALSPNGRWLAGGGEWQGVALEIGSYSTTWISDWSNHPAHWPAFTPDSQWLIAGFHSGQSLFVYRTQPFSYVTNLLTQGGRFAIRPDGKILAASGNNALSFWEIGKWKLDRTYPYPVPSRTVTVAGYSPDGRILFVNRDDRRLGLRDPENNAEFAVLDSPMESFAWSVVFDPASHRFVAPSARPAIAVWNLAKLRQELRDLGLDWSDANPGNSFLGRKGLREVKP